MDTHIREHPHSSREKFGQREVKSPSRGTVLTAVRQGTAEDSVRQQASWGSTRGTVHEAILTVAAEENHSPALKEKLHLAVPISSPPTHLLGSQSHNSSETQLAKATNDHQVTKPNGTILISFLN